MTTTSAQITLPCGVFILSRREDGTLAWSRDPGEALPPPEPGAVLLWDGCVDESQELHLFIHTAARHLVHCRTRDGRHWQRQSLSRLDRDNVLLQDLLVTASPELTLVYRLTGPGSTAAVRYTLSSRGSWQGRQLELPLCGQLRGFCALTPSREGPALYTLHERSGRSHLYQTLLSDAQSLEITSLPGPAHRVRVLKDAQGHLHTLLLGSRQSYADGIPLEGTGTDGCLYEREGAVRCALLQGEKWQVSRLTPGGWQREESLSGPLHLELARGVRQLAPSGPDAPAQSAPRPAGALTQTLHNQALLLTALQESLRQLQQQHFALQAQVKALAALDRSLLSLKERCLALEQAMEALEGMVAASAQGGR